MKSRFKRNILKEKTAWIEPVRPNEKIQLDFQDIRTTKELPESLTYYEPKLLLWIVLFLIFLAIVISDYFLISYFSKRTDINLSLLRQTILTISGAILLSIAFPIIKRIKKKGIKYKFEKAHFKYYELTFNYQDIVGIYTCHAPRRYGMETLNTILLRTKDRVIHKLDPWVRDLNSRQLVSVLSAYLTNYRK